MSETLEPFESYIDPAYEASLNPAPALSAEDVTRAKILKKLTQEPSPESIVSVLQETVNEKLMAELRDELTEGVKDLWFPGTEVRINLEKITADVRDTDYWAELFERYKEGEIKTEDLVDYTILSHLTVSNEPDPLRVMDRQVRQGLQSRIGVKLLGNLADKANKVIGEIAQQMIKALPIQQAPEIKLLGSIQEQEGTDAIIDQNPDIRSLTDNVMGDFKEQILKEFFAGDIIYDQCQELDFEELIDKLSDPDNDEFDTQRYAIVDAGMEQVNKALSRSEYTESAEGKRFVVYTVVLSNLFDGFGGTHSDDRGVNKYILKGEVDHTQFTMLMGLIQQRTFNYLYGRKEFAELIMGWKTRAQLLVEMNAPEYNVFVPDAVSFVKELGHMLNDKSEDITPNELYKFVTDRLNQMGLA